MQTEPISLSACPRLQHPEGSGTIRSVDVNDAPVPLALAGIAGAQVAPLAVARPIESALCERELGLAGASPAIRGRRYREQIPEKIAH